MNSLRLVLVTQRFWPLVGSAERLMAHLAVELARRGCWVTVLTAAWNAGWPARITFRGVPVVRLPHAPRGGRETLRYMWSLGRWLRRGEDRCDLAYVSRLRHEAYAVVRALRGRVPVVLRAEKPGRTGDCLWQIEATCGRRIKRQCMKAAALVGPSEAIQRELQAAGYPRSRIHHVPDGVPIPPPRDPATRATARSVLAEANAAMETFDWMPLAVYTGRLSRGKGLPHLVAAWQPIAARWPNARLWLAGDGPYRAELMRQAEALNLGGRVLAVGVLDEVDELLAAADLFVMPSEEAGTSLSLLEAMAAGLPIVAADTPGNRAVMADGQQGLLVPAAGPRALSAAIARLLDHPDLAARLGTAARERVLAEFSLAKMIDRHLTLFQGLVHPDPNTADN